MFEFKATSSIHALPQPQPYQQLPHSLKRSISNSFTLNDLRTFSKTPGGYTPFVPFWNSLRYTPASRNGQRIRYYYLCAPLPQRAASVYNQTYGSPPPLVSQGPGNSVFQIDGQELLRDSGRSRKRVRHGH